jgi:hypothetical protein
MRRTIEEMKKYHALKQAHTFSSFHSKQLKMQGALAGCFYCEKFFSAIDIKEWIDGDETALCPHCGIDSVLAVTKGSGSYQGTISPEFLKEMNQHWFRDHKGDIKPTFDEVLARAEKAIEQASNKTWPKKVMVREGPRTYWKDKELPAPSSGQSFDEKMDELEDMGISAGLEDINKEIENPGALLQGRGQEASMNFVDAIEDEIEDDYLKAEANIIKEELARHERRSPGALFDRFCARLKGIFN